MKEKIFGKTEKIIFANFYLFAIFGSDFLIQFKIIFWLGLLSNIRHCPSLTLIGLGCQNYVKAWGRGRSALPLKNSKIRLKTIFFQSLPLFALHQNNNCQGWSCKRKVPQKKLRRKNPRGGQICPPPRPTRVNIITSFKVCNFQ